MSDGTTYDDQRLPWLRGVRHEERPPLALAKKVLAAVLVLFLIAGVGLISYLAGRASQREPVSLGTKIVPQGRLTTANTATLPEPAPRPATELTVPPPVARMLEAQSKQPSVVPKQLSTTQSAPRELKKRQAPRAAEFRPSRRVRIARRNVAQPQRVLLASRVVQLGQYNNRREADAAYARLARVYPYLRTLPKTVPSARAPTGNARAYFLRLKAHSPDHARILCQNLISIGRGCAVLPERT